MITLGKVIEQISKMQVKSITDPLFRYSATVYALGVAAAVFKTAEWVTIFLFVIATLLLVIALFFYCYHSIKSPEYLRSEIYQQNKQIIELLGDSENALNPNLKDLKYISSPFSKETDRDTFSQIGDGKNE